MIEGFHREPAILRRKQVEIRTGLARSTIYQYIKDGVFPKPVQLGPRAVGWIESEVSACNERPSRRNGTQRRQCWLTESGTPLAKAVENVARLAALFHVLEQGPAGTIGIDAVAAAIRLDEWLRREARAGKTNRISVRRIFQYGPKCARDNQAFKSIMALLTERGRARLENEGRRRYVVINPALIDEGCLSFSVREP